MICSSVSPATYSIHDEEDVVRFSAVSTVTMFGWFRLARRRGLAAAAKFELCAWAPSGRPSSDPGVLGEITVPKPPLPRAERILYWPMV